MLPLPIDTKRALGLADDAESAAVATACESRSLLLDRYANPQLKEVDRNAFFASAAKRPCASARSSCWLALLGGGSTSTRASILHGQIQSRLMVNMAGGVMENAGMCLDRFGIPYIPGSAVKGCARRAAVAALHEWFEAGKPSGDENLFTPACERFATPVEMLAEIALVFGWGEEDWDIRKRTREGRLKSDLIYAVGEKHWPEAFQQAGNILLGKEAEQARDFGHFAGCVSFLPAYPIKVGAQSLPVPEPELGKLELDVVTCHHGDYYRGIMDVATDTEDPVPVVFPAVAPGHVFTFALMPLRNSPARRLSSARNWLATGLATFGLGAKTAAGYGCFDVRDDLQLAVRSAMNAAEERQLKEQQDREAETKRIAEEKQDRERREEMKAAMSTLTPEQQEDYRVARLSDDQFRSALDNFAKRSVEEQKAIVCAMRLGAGASGGRGAFWDDLKARAQKRGGKYAQTEQAIRQLSKQMFPGKDGKMP